MSASANELQNGALLETDETPTRHWWKSRTFLAVLAIVLAGGGVVLWGAVSTTTSPPLETHTVARGDLRVTVVAEGTLESSKNTEIKCRVRGGYGGRGGMSTVTWVIPTGSVVKKGDILVRLDTKIIDETVSLGKTDTNNAKAALARAEADLAKAKIAVEGYLNGTFRKQMKLLQKQSEVAKRNLSAAQKMLRNSESLFKKGYVTELEVEGNRSTVRQAQLELNVKATEIDVLNRLTKAMELETLNGQFIATQARVAGRKAGLALEQGKLDLAKVELKNHTIRAERPGLVIYPSTAKWKNTPDVTEGARVHNNQILLLMPDLSQMQVKIGIHESMIHRVKAGMPASVRLPSGALSTKVYSVAAIARPAGWWDGNAVKYDTLIKLPHEDGLRPGMTAEVEVTIAHYENVVSVPVRSVLQTKTGFFCWVQTETDPQKRELKLGDSNDEFIVVTEGVNEGDVVVLDPLKWVAEARELVRPERTQAVVRGELVSTITEQGTLESSNNTVIKCQVRGESTINWVIESGTRVKKGDKLLELENNQIVEYLNERTKFAHLSRDAAIGFRANANRAKLAIAEYLEGRYVKELIGLEKDLAIARQRLSTAKNMLQHAEMMAERGYISQLVVDDRTFSVKRSQLAVKLVTTQIEVLKKYTREEQLTELTGEWKAAKAAANGHEEVLSMDNARIELAKKEIKRCTVRAVRDGLVIYPKTAIWKNAPDIAEGATVQHDQILFLMPDLTRMQVKVGIHESMIDRVKPGMTAKVTIVNQVLTGKVVIVAKAAQPSGWWTGNVVKYDTIIQLPTATGLKPGMSAEVKIVLAEHTNALKVPLTAVVRSPEGDYCLVQSSSGDERRTVTTGDNDEKFVVIKGGLQEGEQVVVFPDIELAP